MRFDVSGFYNEGDAHGYYHQDERDRAVGLGCMGLCVVLAMICMAMGVAACWMVAP